MYEFIEFARDGEVGIITLNRPAVLNAWHQPMRDELEQCLEACAVDEAVRAIVITGAGTRAFSAGQDLDETRHFTSAADGAAWSAAWKALYGTLRAIEKPIVAALNGVAAGSAFQVAMMADVRVGHAATRMGQPEINSGIPSTMGPWLISERLGISRTVELTLTGRMMDGEECHRIGLLHQLVPAGEVLATAVLAARRLAAKPAVAIRLNKRRFREITEAGFRSASEAGARIQAEAYASGEPQAAMARFFAAREARKKGA